MLATWIFQDTFEAYPCKCCDAPRAMDHMDGYWHCDESNQTWLVLSEPFDSSKPHDFNECLGNCSVHCLVTDQIVQMIHSEAFEQCWGDIIMEELILIQSLETPKERAEREAKEKADEEARQLATKATAMFNYGERMKRLNTVRAGREYFIEKNGLPCKWLFLDEKAPKSTWTRNRDGKLEPPVRKHMTGAQCWAHEYNDPKTGKLVVKHTCKYIHPEEEGWHPEWASDKSWKPPAAEKRDFSGLSHAARAPPPPPSHHSTHKPAPKSTGRCKKTSRNAFEALDDWS